MSLINKLTSLARSVKEASKLSTNYNKIDLRASVIQKSPGLQKVLRQTQRLLDKALGYDNVPGHPILEFVGNVKSLERTNFGPPVGNGLTLTLSQVPVMSEFTITTVADVSSSLNDTYFLLDSKTQGYYVWFNVDAAGTDPEVAGRVGLEVALLEDATADDVAGAIAGVLVGLGFDVEVTDDTLELTSEVEGIITPPEDSSAAPTSFTFNVVQPGVEASGYTIDDAGVTVGDCVQPLEGQAKGKMLKILEVIDNRTLRLEDDSNVVSLGTNIRVRFMLSTVKKHSMYK